MSKRRGQWFGDRVSQSVQDIPLIADVIQILPPAVALESIRDVVFERAVISFQVTRILTTDVTDLLWMAYHGRVGDGTVIPLEALNPRSAAATTMAHRNIMQVGALQVNSIVHLFDSAGAPVTTRIDGSVESSMVDFDVKRKIARGTEGVFLTMAASVKDVVRVSVAWRTYYTYA